MYDINKGVLINPRYEDNNIVFDSLNLKTQKVTKKAFCIPYCTEQVSDTRLDNPRIKDDILTFDLYNVTDHTLISEYLSVPLPTTGNPNLLTYTAGETLSSHMPVALINNKLYKYNSLNPDHMFAFVGFTKQSGTLNTSVQVEDKFISLSGWGLTPNTIYVAGPNGTLLTQNNISGSFTKVLGFAESTNDLLIYKHYTPILKN